MTGLDEAIRKAIDRADAHDAAARRRVYGSARTALEKGLARKPDLDEQAADVQRRRFDALIERIEAEKAGTEAASDDVPAIDPASRRLPDPPSAERSRRSDHRAVSHEAGQDPVSAPSASDKGPAENLPDGSLDGLSDEIRAARPAGQPAKGARASKKARSSERTTPKRKGEWRRLLSALFLLAALVVFALLGLWLLGRTGLLDEAGDGPNTFTKFDAAANGGVPDLVTEDGFNGTWKPIFPDAGGETVTTGAKATKTEVTNERGKALRLTSATNAASGDIRIAIPTATLDAMAGKRTTIALNVRGVGGKQTQIAVECSFATLGGCRRRRFEIHGEMTDVVFDVDFTQAAPPSRPGYLLVNTDIRGGARAIDLFAAGMRVAK